MLWVCFVRVGVMKLAILDGLAGYVSSPAVSHNLLLQSDNLENKYSITLFTGAKVQYSEHGDGTQKPMKETKNLPCVLTHASNKVAHPQ